MSLNKILLVDDNKGQRVTLESILKHAGFDVVTADCGNAAIEAAEKEDFAAALLDIKMPDITGIDVLKVIKRHQPDLIVIMMTGYAETEYAVGALNSGASAYLLKPVNIEQVKILLKQALEHHRLVEENKAMSNALVEWKNQLEEKVVERTKQLEDTFQSTFHLYEELKRNFESTLEVLSIAIDQRDPLTASHSFRVTEYAVGIGKLMNLGLNDIEKLRYSGLMHDLGKIEIKEDVLQKEGSLTTEEYHHIQGHAKGTFELLSKFKFRNELSDVPLIASSHHERFDGTGYPQNLRGENIPLMARVLAVADVLDAITSKRHYRQAMAIDNALGILKRECGGHFDPDVVEAFFKMRVSDFLRIHNIDDIRKLKALDMTELQKIDMQWIKQCFETESPSSEQLAAIQRFQKYYMGPIPSKYQNKIFPSSNC
ncbi:MAG: HD domain-containing phosphohydrolase [Elusimicrobiota bacterium]